MTDRIQAPATERTEVHASFVIERSIASSVAEVWHALSDRAARDQWFGGDPGFEVADRTHDFRIGGRTTEQGEWHAGPRSRFEAVYTDIVPDHRIVFTYDLWVDDRHLSTSLTTIVVAPDVEGAHLTYVE